MARRPIPTVSAGQLRPLDRDGRPTAPLAVGSREWRRWVADEANGSFAYHSPRGSFTARRERRGDRAYWYAYRTLDGRLRKAYLGDDGALSVARLEQAAAQLAARPAAHAPAARADDPLLPTLLQPPPPDPSLVPRPRLTKLLDGHPGVRLALVTAPAGYGKTTLVSAWLARVDGPAGWLSVEPSHNDDRRFWRYLLAALEPLAPAQQRAELRGLLAAGYPEPERLIAAALALLGPARGALVIDDYHQIESPAVHGGLAYLIERAPPGLRLVIASRSVPPLPLARLRARGQLIEVEAAALRLQQAESAALLNGMMGLGLSAAQLAELDARVDGWAAGLRLFGLVAQTHPDPGAVIALRAGAGAGFGGGHRFVFDYLAEEVLRHLPAATQRFLLETSVLGRLSPELCDALVREEGGGMRDGGSGARASDSSSCIPLPSSLMLAELERAGLFISPLDAGRRWLRYHPLFAEFLAARLAQERPERAPELHRRAAGWYAARGMAAEAISHSIAAGDWPAAVEQAALAAPQMILRGETLTLQRWVEQLPPAAARGRADLAMYMAWSLLVQGELEAVEPWLQAAELHQPPASPERDGLAGELAAVRSGLAVLNGDLGQGQALAAQARGALPRDSIFHSVVDFFDGIIAELAGSRAEAEAAYALAAERGRAEGNVIVAVVARCSLGLLHTSAGRLREAERLHREALELARGPDGALLPPAGMAYAGLAGLALLWNDLAAAEGHARSCLDLAAEWREPDTLLNARLVLSRIHAARGDLEGAARQLDEALADTPVESVFGGREALQAERARLSMVRGRPDEATAWLVAAGLSAEGRLQPYRGQYLLAAQIMAAQSRGAEARRWLDWLAERGAEDGRAGDLAATLAARARLRLAEGDRGGAEDDLRQSLRLMADERPIRPFIEDDAPLLPLLRAVARTPEAADLRPYIGQILAAATPAPEDAPGGQGGRQPGLIEQLSPRERDVLGLLAEGLDNRRIAERLVITVGTVKRHLNGLYGKLDAHSRTEALVRARALGLL